MKGKESKSDALNRPGRLVEVLISVCDFIAIKLS